MKRTVLGKAIREYLNAHPDATTEAVMEATGCENKQQIYQARTYARRVVPKKIAEPINLEVQMPASGLRLKLREGRRMVGTLSITHTGVKFTPANGKKMPERQVAWKLLKALSDLVVE